MHLSEYWWWPIYWFQHTDSVLPKLVSSIHGSTFLSIMAANKDEIHFTARSKNPTLTSEHGTYDHFTPKEKAHVEK